MTEPFSLLASSTMASLLGGFGCLQTSLCEAEKGKTSLPGGCLEEVLPLWSEDGRLQQTQEMNSSYVQ